MYMTIMTDVHITLVHYFLLLMLLRQNLSKSFLIGIPSMTTLRILSIPQQGTLRETVRLD